jgi:hypothetical protein
MAMDGTAVALATTAVALADRLAEARASLAAVHRRLAEAGADTSDLEIRLRAAEGQLRAVLDSRSYRVGHAAAAMLATVRGRRPRRRAVPPPG